MQRIDYILFGYRMVEFSPLVRDRLVNALLRIGVNTTIHFDSFLYIRESDVARIRYLVKPLKLTVSIPLGLPGALHRFSRRYSCICVMLICSFFVLFSSSLVWDVRVVGNLSVPDYVVKEALADCGLAVGDFWWSFNKRDVETDLLQRLPSVGWISINRRGTVAYAEVVETEPPVISPPATVGANNIVAAFNGVIEEITVECGSAVVKVGDVVKKGDVLISGVVETSEGIRLSSAEGTVLAKVSADLTVNVPRSSTVTVNSQPRLSEIRVSFFDISLIFLNLGRQNDYPCDIIQSNNNFILFNKYVMPIGLVRTYSVYKSEENVVYTDRELVDLASRRMKNEIIHTLSGSELLKLRTDGDLSEQGYTMRSYVVFITDIGLKQEIKTD